MSSVSEEVAEPQSALVGWANPTEPQIPAFDRWRVFAICLALVLAVAAPLWHLHVINREMSSSKADLVQVWTGVRATLNGRDAYSEQVTQEIETLYYGRPLNQFDTVNDQRFIYPAHTAIVLAPIARVSWPVVRLGFLIVMPLFMAASVPLWLRILDIKTSHIRLAILVLLTLASWPMMWGFRLCQPTLIVAAFLVAGCYLLRRGHDVSAGLFFALSTIKPQLVAPVIVWLLLWTLLARRWRFIASFLGATSTLLLSSVWLAPGWVARWLVAMAAAYSHDLPDRPIFRVLFGPWPGTALMIAVAVGTGVILWRHRRCDVNSPEFGAAIGLALATTVSLIPGNLAMIYNQVLLLPAILILIWAPTISSPVARGRRICLALVAWGFGSVLLAVLGESLLKSWGFWTTLPFLNVLLPICVTVALAVRMVLSSLGQMSKSLGMTS